MLVTSNHNQVDEIYKKTQELLNRQKFPSLLATVKKAYKRLNLTDAQYLTFVVLEINALANTGKLYKAEALLKEKWSQFSKSQQIETANLIGTAYATSNISPNPELALFYLKKSFSLDDSIRNAQTAVMLIQLYMLIYDYTESERLWLKISKWQEHFDFIIIQRLMSSYLLNFKSIAVDSVKFMLRNKNEISKRNYELLIHYLIYLKFNDEAKGLLNGGLDNILSDDAKVYLNALLAFENNDTQLCINTLKNIKNHFSSSYNLLAKSEERLGNYPDAFNYFEYSASKIYEENEGKSFSDYLKQYSKIDFAKLLFNLELKENAEDNKNKLNIRIGGKKAELCFMIGFPRSGTTLLDNILDSQRNISVLSELGTMERLIAKYNRITGKSYPHGIESLSSENIILLREEYNFLVNNYLKSRHQLEDEHNNKNENVDLIVDKMPLHSIHLPFIRCLFPEVKVICSIRHPLDVVLSNFQQSYEMNDEMSFLVSMEDCVNRYIDVFQHIARCAESLNLCFHYVKYEDLVSDFEKHAISTFEYLNVTPNESYKTFYKHASNKIVATSSRLQVSNDIYKTSKYKWRNYSEQLDSYKEKLKYFIEKFGYEL